MQASENKLGLYTNTVLLDKAKMQYLLTYK